MGRKVNPIGFRLPVRRDWKSRWYAKGRGFTDWVIKDVHTRRMIERDYAAAMISKIEIEQKIGSVRVIIHAARPGVVIGKKGEGVDRLRANLRKLFNADDVQVDTKEVAQPETDAKVIALNIANQLENRVMFRRAMRRALANAMRLKVDGIKIMSAGRLNGIEIARTEWYREGRVPLHTLKNDIDYGFAEASTAMGVVGVKVWVSKGDTYGFSKKVKYAYDAAAGAEDAASAPAAAPAPDAADVATPAPAPSATPVAKTIRAAGVSGAEGAAAEGGAVEAEAEAETKPAAKKAAAKKDAAPAAKKPAAKKPAAKKAATPAAKKAAKPTAKPAAKKPAAKKPAAKKGDKD